MEQKTEEEKRKELNFVINEYSNLLYRICILILKSKEDTQDVLQETFIRYMEKMPKFEAEEQRKAWLIKVSQNKCKDFLRFHKRHQYVELSEVEELIGIDEKKFDLEELWKLPAKYKSVILLYYVEGYSVREIASLLQISEGAVKKRMQRGREQLRSMLGDEMEMRYEYGK